MEVYDGGDDECSCTRNKLEQGDPETRRKETKTAKSSGKVRRDLQKYGDQPTGIVGVIGKPAYDVVATNTRNSEVVTLVVVEPCKNTVSLAPA